MDPFSLVASVAGLIALTIKVISAVDNYATMAKDAPTEIQSLKEELELLRGILTDIEKTFFEKAKCSGKDGGDGVPPADVETVVKTVAGCQAHLLRALALLDEYGIADGEATKSTRDKYKAVFKRLKYSFNREYVQRLLTVIRDYKSSLTLALSLEGKKSRDEIKSMLARLEAVSIQSEDSLMELREQNMRLLSAIEGTNQPPSYLAATATAENERHFMVPQQPTATFVSRADIMSKIQQHFHHNSSAEPQQRRCAIYGLGGSGKTQIALKYAFTHKSSYQNVFFINAASQESATADFIRIHGLLRLSTAGSDREKAEAVKRWLSRESNSSWLLIIDNADDLDELDLWDYIPVLEAGDILITTRDARIDDPELSSLAIHLEMLPLGDAVDLLLKRAAVRPTLSDDEKKAAESVATELGCLPLAIDQAGAYMSTRKKSFKEYLELYSQQQESLLGYKRKLSRHQKTVLTTWELSFDRIDSDSPDVALLFLLLCQYDNAYIPDSMLKRGTAPQISYGRDGEEVQLSSESSGVPKNLIDLVSDEFRFDEAVEKLTSYSLVRRLIDGGFVLHSLVQFCGQRRATDDMRRVSFETSIRILSHAFPRGSIDDWNTAFSIELLPQVEHCCRRLEKDLSEGNEMVSINVMAASLFLSAYHFANTQWCQRFVELSGKLLAKTPPQQVGLMADHEFLTAFLAERRGKLCPELGEPKKGIEILRAFVQNRPDIRGNPDAVDPNQKKPNHLANSMHGCIFVLLAHQLIGSGKSDEALRYLLAWKPFEPTSISERGVVRYRDRTLTDLYVSNEKWREAESVLRPLLSEEMQDSATFAGTLGEGWTIQQLAEILIETERYTDASAILIPAITAREEAGNLDREDTVSLMLDLVNSLLGQKAFDAAMEQLFKIRQVLARKGESINSQMNSATSSQMMLRGLTHMWCLVARLSYRLENWHEAKSCFGKALETARQVQWPNGFMVAAIQRSLACSLWKLGRFQDAADTDLDLEGGRQLTDAGIDRRWVDHLKEAGVQIRA